MRKWRDASSWWLNMTNYCLSNRKSPMNCSVWVGILLRDNFGLLCRSMPLGFEPTFVIMAFMHPSRWFTLLAWELVLSYFFFDMSLSLFCQSGRTCRSFFSSFSVCSSLSLLILGRFASLYSFNSDCTVCSCSFNKFNSCDVWVSGWLDGLLCFFLFLFKLLCEVFIQ